MSSNQSATGKPIKLRYPSTCRTCGSQLAKGEPAIHFAKTRSVACVECAEAVLEPAQEHAARSSALESHAGASAQREYERRVQKRQDALTDRWGNRLGKTIAWIEDDKQSTKAWSTGARGEREVAEYLEKKLTGSACILLHDRKIPGTRANIDHLVVGPSGVTVLDAKNYKGKVRVERVGFGKKRRSILRVNGRDKTTLIAGVAKQMLAVQKALADHEPQRDVPVRGGLCWWNYEGLPMFGALAVDGIPVLSPRASYRLAGEDGPFGPGEIGAVAELLADWFPKA